MCRLRRLRRLGRFRRLCSLCHYILESAGTFLRASESVSGLFLFPFLCFMPSQINTRCNEHLELLEDSERKK